MKKADITLDKRLDIVVDYLLENRAAAGKTIFTDLGQSLDNSFHTFHSLSYALAGDIRFSSKKTGYGVLYFLKNNWEELQQEWEKE